MKYRRADSQAAFTLVEALIAFTLLGVFVVSLMTMMSRFSRSRQQHYDHSRLSGLEPLVRQRIMEAIRAVVAARCTGTCTLAWSHMNTAFPVTTPSGLTVSLYTQAGSFPGAPADVMNRCNTSPALLGGDTPAFTLCNAAGLYLCFAVTATANATTVEAEHIRAYQPVIVELTHSMYDASAGAALSCTQFATATPSNVISKLIYAIHWKNVTTPPGGFSARFGQVMQGFP